MALKLVKGSYEYKNQIIDMLKEWIAYNEQHPKANTSPYAIFKNDYHDFDYYLNNLEIKEAKDNLVADSIFFCFDDQRNIIIHNLVPICQQNLINIVFIDQCQVLKFSKNILRKAYD